MDGPDLVSTLSARTQTYLADGKTANDLRSVHWVHPHHGLVRPASVSLEQPALRVADAIGLMTPGCALGGWASLWYQRVAMVDGTAWNGAELPVRVHCGAGAQIRSRAGIEPCHAEVLDGEMVDLGAFSCTTLARAAYDEMRLASGLREAVVVADMATSTTARGAHTSRQNVHDLVARHHKTRGIVQARTAMSYVSTRSASPLESRMRVFAITEAGIEAWLVNVPVFDLYENLLGIVDLIEPRAALVLESDGGDHRERVRHDDDNAREERLERHNLTVVRAGSADLGCRLELGSRIRGGYRDGIARNRARDRWTLEKPGWWWSWPPGRRWD